MLLKARAADEKPLTLDFSIDLIEEHLDVPFFSASRFKA